MVQGSEELVRASRFEGSDEDGRWREGRVIRETKITSLKLPSRCFGRLIPEAEGMGLEPLRILRKILDLIQTAVQIPVHSQKSAQNKRLLSPF